MDAEIELERRRRELEALQAIAAQRGGDVRSVIDAAIAAVHRTFGAAMTTWFRFDPATGRIVIHENRGVEPPVRSVALGEGLSGRAALTRQPQLTADYEREVRQGSEGLPVLKGVMAAPVLVGDELLGVLGVGSSDKAYDASELSVLTSVANQLATAFDNARLLERLRASELRHRSLVEAMPYAVYEARRSGELLYASPKLAELTGYPLERFEREPGLLLSLVHAEDRAARDARTAALARPGDRATLEYRLVHANGVEIVWVSDTLLAREAPGGEVVLQGILADQRERKLIEAAAREHARLASLGELAAGVAHEVNNPLAGVMSYAQLAKRILEVHAADPAELAARLREPLDGILAEAERILEITRTLVSFARRPEMEAFRPLAPHELVRASLTIMKQRLKENSIALEVDVPLDLPAMRARGHELTQVLQNLIINARDALNERFPRWDARKKLSFKGEALPPDASSPHGYVRLSVSDGGTGIASADLPRVFVPFFTTKPHGTGLGLAIAREIVVAHGGRIDVKSDPGSGTTFSFEVPVF